YIQASVALCRGCVSLIRYLPDVFPRKLHWLRRLTVIKPKRLAADILKIPKIAAADPLRIIEHALPSALSLKAREVIPRLKEGGVFVNLSHDIGTKVSE